ncbi:MAG: zinc ribbon domain-containing protein [Collinsella sp.]|nr:zinc ribbon domain-containing protein [Collinsella sp.]
MNCPHCLKTVDPTAGFCPHCGTRIDGASSGSEPVFCEGCGARLFTHDRICPKCGRPAPGILSTSSASRDLAAGRTASFPRLSQHAIDGTPQVPHVNAPTAAQVLDDSMDPSSTNILDASRIDASVAGDPYHENRKRRWGPFLAIVLLLAAIGGGVYFVLTDPLGVMPGFMDSFQDAASDMFPSRQLPQGSAQQASADATPPSSEPGPMTDSEVFQVLSSSHNKIVSAFESLGGIIEDYEYGFIASDRAVREERSASAFASRDLIDSVLADLDALDLDDDSPYIEDVEHLKQLAGWVRIRLDMYCASWDISLSYNGSDLPSAHMDEILTPLRDRAQDDSAARDEYFAHVEEWKPVEKTS